MCRAGNNQYGQLGTTASSSPTTMVTQPVSVPGLPAGNITSISVGYQHSCAVVGGRDRQDGTTVNGTAWCWGFNSYYQLGDGTATSSATPVQVVGLPDNVTQVVAGHYATCAIVADGSVYCVGANNYGQTGTGSGTASSGNVQTALKVKGLEDVVVTQITMGYYSAAALTCDGKVYSWGYNDYYQVGDYTLTDRDTAVETTVIPDDYIVTHVSVGRNSACVSTLDGASLCWGYGAYANLGHGTAVSSASEPVLVTGYEGTNLPTSAPTPLPTPLPTTDRSTSIGVAYQGDWSLHVVDDSGGLWYAGYGYTGRLGNADNSGTIAYDLGRIAGVNNVVKFDQRFAAGIALTASGAVWYVVVVGGAMCMFPRGWSGWGGAGTWFLEVKAERGEIRVSAPILALHPFPSSGAAVQPPPRVERAPEPRRTATKPQVPPRTETNRASVLSTVDNFTQSTHTQPTPTSSCVQVLAAHRLCLCAGGDGGRKLPRRRRLRRGVDVRA